MEADSRDEQYLDIEKGKPIGLHARCGIAHGDGQLDVPAVIMLLDAAPKQSAAFILSEICTF
ncbi:hypothetical protein [Extibacter muris]|uniref:hypothetical protein n=1 Tax=Extibacter muris TaxID=1796622 RepID=UPI001FA9F8D9|nr:hypothetical protein [Extibacter muris]MCU0078618.1 hypothetical protein [Extibacter muris]